MRRKADDPSASRVSTDASHEAVDRLALSAATGSARSLDQLLALIIEHRLAAPAIARLTNNPTLAEDIEQDVLVAVTRSIHSFRGEAKFTTWLYSLARNVAVGTLRRTTSDTELAADDLLHEDKPRRMSSQVAQRHVVHQAIDSLPDHLRHAVYLRDVEGLSYQDIADHLNIELNTVRVKTVARSGHAGLSTLVDQRVPVTDIPETASDTPYYVGQYRIMDAIGVGSSAAVYRGLDEASETEVAIKILADNFSLVTEIRRRFIEEAELLMSIRSPAVAQVYGQGETDGGQPYIVLELADRGTLGDRVDGLRRQGRAPNEADLLAVGAHLAEALAAVHRAGIVHRDVSPGNILISAEPTPTTDSAGVVSDRAADVLAPGERYLLADLGFAKNLRQASGLTAGGGTKGFAAPEQQGEVTVVDHRADVFGATSMIAWLAEGTELLDPITPFLQTGLAEIPEDRHQTMDDWFRDLRQRLDRRPVAFPNRPTQDRSTSSAPPSVTDRSRRWRAPMVALAALGLAAVVAALALFFTAELGDEGDTTASDAVTTIDPQTSSTDGSASLTNSTASTTQSAAAPTTTPIGTPSTDTASASTASTNAAPVSTASTNTVLTTSSVSPSTATTASTTSAPTSSAVTTSTVLATTTSATAPTSATTTSTSTATTTTTAAPPTTLDTTTTTDPRFEFSPRAYIESPTAEAQVTGDLRIDGVAQYREGITGVLLTVRRIDDDFVWNPASSSFVDQWLRFPVQVAPPEANDVTWTFTVDQQFLEPGRYMIRVWARGNGANDPVSDRIEIVVPVAS